MINFLDILIQKYQGDTLGHFYILEPSRVLKTHSLLQEWVHDFLSQCLHTNSLINHADVLEIFPSKDKSTYQLEDLKALFGFLSHRPIRAKRKFIIINNSEKLSVNVSNKLLKTLEEPPVACTIFMLNPTRISLLETIQSRGIKLRVPLEQTSDNAFAIDFLKNVKDKPIHKIIESLKSEMDLHLDILIALIELCSGQINNAKSLLLVEQVMHEYQQDKIYHNAPTHRLFALALLIKKISL